MKQTIKTAAYGLVSKGNGEAWLICEKHTSLATGGGQAGQGYPCVLVTNGTDNSTGIESESRNDNE